MRSVLANSSAPSDIGQPNNTDASKLVINGGTLNYMGGSVGIDRGVTAGPNNATIAVSNSASTLTMNGLITGPGMLVKGGSGTMILPTANTMAGGTTVAAGTVQIGTIAALGTAPTNYVNGTLDLNSQNLPATSVLMMGNNSTLMNTGGGMINYGMIGVLNGNNYWTLAGTGDWTNIWLNGPGSPNWHVTNTVTGTVTLAGTNDNSGLWWVQNSTGTTLLAKTSTNSGSASSIEVSKGLVKVAYQNAWLPGNNNGGQSYYNGTWLINGGTFDMNGCSQVTGNLQSSTTNSGVLINNGNTPATLILWSGNNYHGIIQDGNSTISIVKTNTGTQVIDGNNQFTGGLIAANGTIIYGGGEADSPIFNYPVGIGTVNQAGTIRFNISGNYNMPLTLVGNGTLGLNNTNMVLTVLHNYTDGLFTGPMYVYFGTLHLVPTGDWDTLVNSTITVDNNINAALLVDDTGGNYSPITGSLVMNGALSQMKFNFDGGSGYFQVKSNVTAAGALVTVNIVGSPLGKNAFGYNLMAYSGTLSGNFATIPVITGAGYTGAYDSYITTGNGYVRLVVLDSFKWTKTGNGVWSDDGNWSKKPVIAGEVATLGASGAGLFTTVTVDADYHIGGFFFTNANSFAVVGPSTLTLDNGGGAPASLPLRRPARLM